MATHEELINAINTKSSRALLAWARQEDGCSQDSKVTLTSVTTKGTTAEIEVRVEKVDGSGSHTFVRELLLSPGEDIGADLSHALQESVNTLAEQGWEAIESLFEDYGNDDYIGEAVSQEAHALQAAACAADAGFPPAIIIGALLHDIGHLIGLRTPEAHDQMANCGTMNHEKIGGAFVRRHGMSEATAQVIEGHVDAKRYLCYADKDYYHKLTDASKTTLTFQGGVMNENEANTFRNLEAFDAIVKMRAWDEAAKVPDKVVPPLASYKDLVVTEIVGNNPVDIMVSPAIP